ncbi:MAG TPA: hypothetical protein VGB55_05445, partial [Tepidisphaeraceae bacterium]
MSPLTKLFVVLLVLISVVMTAGVVTFVNKIDPLQQKLTAASTRADTADALLTQRSADLATATGQLDTLRATHQTEINGLQTTTQTLRTQLEQNQGQIAQLNGQIAVLTSANASNSAALMASESTKKNMSEQV